jgi:hypothetical protein
MTFVLVMWIIWAALIVITAAFYIYRSRLQRDEEDQIFLDDAFSQEKAAQETITAKVNKIQPALAVLKWLDIAATVVVIVYYLWDIVAQFK